MSDDERQKASEDNIEEKEVKIAEKTTTKDITLMKKGDYQVHILLEEVKNLIQIKDDKLPYPVVKITCFDKSKRSEKPETAVDSYTIEEHFYFDKANLSVEQLDSSKIVLEVYDAENSRKKSDYFGIYEYDLQYIYSMKNHSMMNTWLALSNPESSDMTQVRGFLKLSISVLNDNDPRVELNLNPNSGECQVPSQIKMQYELLSIYLIRAEELPDMDSILIKSKKNRPCDPFVKITYQGQKVQSTVSKNKNDVAEWNEILNIPVSVPTVSQRIVLNVIDYDSGSNDDPIGSVEINVNFKNKLRRFDTG